VVAFLGISCSAAFADGTDPKVFTSGCGGKGQPACDADVLTPENLTLPISLTFNNVGGQEVAFVDIINDTGKDLNDFSVGFSVNPGLVFSGCQSGGLLTCTPNFEGSVTSGVANYTLSGATICSTNGDDWLFGDVGGSLLGKSFYINDHDADDNCQWGFRLELIGQPGDTILNGETVSGSVSAPEPPSGLLLFTGLFVAFFATRKLSVPNNA